jgi:hypothetical protein
MLMPRLLGMELEEEPLIRFPTNGELEYAPHHHLYPSASDLIGLMLQQL